MANFQIFKLIPLLVLWLLVASGNAVGQRKAKPKQRIATIKKDTIVRINPKQPRPIKIRVLSYNMTHGMLDNGKTNLVQLAEVIKQFRPDFVAIQELDSGAARSGKLNQIKILALLTGYETLFTKTLTLEDGIGTHGIGILTPHSFDVVHNRIIPSPENSEPRYMQSILVEMAAGRHVHFVNTALDDYSPLNRGLQAAFINNLLTNSIYPVIIAGSFGVTIGDHTLESFTKNWNHYPEDDVNEVEVAPEDRRTDYLWLPKTSLWKLVQYEVLSQPSTTKHQPTMATFVWHH